MMSTTIPTPTSRTKSSTPGLRKHAGADSTVMAQHLRRHTSSPLSLICVVPILSGSMPRCSNHCCRNSKPCGHQQRGGDRCGYSRELAGWSRPGVRHHRAPPVFDIVTRRRPWGEQHANQPQSEELYPAHHRTVAHRREHRRTPLSEPSPHERRARSRGVVRGVTALQVSHQVGTTGRRCRTPAPREQTAARRRSRCRR